MRRFWAFVSVLLAFMLGFSFGYDYSVRQWAQDCPVYAVAVPRPCPISNLLVEAR